ncbi:MAG TPA: hypothetical protein VE690_02070 [Rhodopila sp.]|nr:hypothetical protein [Rhodopila sp.]
MPAITGSIRRSRRLVFAVVAVIAILVLAAATAIVVLRQVAVSGAEDDNRRLTVVLAEQTTRTVQAVDVVLQDISEKIAASGVHDDVSFHQAFGTRDLHEMLVRRLTDLPQAEAITILDSTDHFVNVSRRWPPPEYGLAERSYFRHCATTPDSGPYPYISEPATSVSSGAATAFLVRRLSACGGTFLGVIVAPILLDYFERFFVKAGFATGQGVIILRRDGTVLVRFPREGVATGTRMPPHHQWFDVVAQGGGHYRSPGAFKAVQPSLVSVHVLTLYPLVVDVTRSNAATLARWWRQAVAIGLGTLLTTVSLALLLRALGRQFTLIVDAQARIDAQVIMLSESAPPGSHPRRPCRPEPHVPVMAAALRKLCRPQ